MRSEEDFESFYEESLSGEVAEIRAKQKAILRMALLLGAVSLLLVFATYVLCKWSPNVPDWLWLPAAFIFPIGAAWIHRSFFWIPQISRAYLEALYEPTVRFLGPNLEVLPSRYVPFEVLQKSKLFFFHPDHYVGASLAKEAQDERMAMMFPEEKDDTSQFSWIESAFNRGSEEKPKWENIFKGLFYAGKAMSRVKTPIFIFSSPIQRNFGHLGKRIQEINPRRGKFVELSHNEVEDYYVFYSANPNDAREGLPDEFLDELVTFYEATELEVSLSLMDNKIYVAVHDLESLFSFSPWFQANVEEAAKKLFFAISFCQELPKKLVDKKFMRGQLGGMDGGFGAGNPRGNLDDMLRRLQEDED